MGVAKERLSSTEKMIVIENMKSAIEPNYVFADQTDGIIQALDERARSGKYNSIRDHEAFAEALTHDLLEITNNKHFAVVYNPGFIKARRAPDDGTSVDQATETEAIDWNRWYAVQDNYGFEKIEILDGNIGYIKLDFFQPLDWVQPTIDATMGFVRNTDALIIDLTENGGGYSPTDAYLASFFFREGSGLWSSNYNRPTGESSSVELFDEINGERYLNKPVYILVSANTFSLAERLAYGMKHFGKAVIVGQTSAGAAHAIEIAELNDNFFIQIPIIYNIHPVTKTDWEGAGVIPDVEVSKNNAKQTAHRHALDKLIELSNHERIKQRYVDIRAKLEASPIKATQ